MMQMCQRRKKAAGGHDRPLPVYQAGQKILLRTQEIGLKLTKKSQKISGFFFSGFFLQGKLIARLSLSGRIALQIFGKAVYAFTGFIHICLAASKRQTDIIMPAFRVKIDARGDRYPLAGKQPFRKIQRIAPKGRDIRIKIKCAVTWGAALQHSSRQSSH